MLGRLGGLYMIMTRAPAQSRASVLRFMHSLAKPLQANDLESGLPRSRQVKGQT